MSTATVIEPAVVPAVDSDAAEKAEKAEKAARDWFSGWCGPGPTCRDGLTHNKVGEEIRQCRHVGINGPRALRPFVVCACSCHTETPVPDLSDVEEAWKDAHAAPN